MSQLDMEPTDLPVGALIQPVRHWNRRIYPSEQDICQLDDGTDGFTRRSRISASQTLEPTDYPSEQDISQLDTGTDGFTRRSRILAS